MAQEQEQMMAAQQQQTMLEQAGQLANSKLVEGKNLQDLGDTLSPPQPE